jgi:hypothetical protein
VLTCKRARDYSEKQRRHAISQADGKMHCLEGCGIQFTETIKLKFGTLYPGTGFRDFRKVSVLFRNDGNKLILYS